MVRRSRSWVVAAGVLLIVAACGSTAPSSPGSSTAPGPGASASGTAAASSPSAAPSSPPIAAGPAWTAVLDKVDADGKVAKEVALEAFALAFGGLPGVTLPSGDAGSIRSGSMAVRWLVSYWGELTPEQRAAAVAAIPELAGIPATSSRPSGITLAAVRPVEPTTPTPLAAQQRTNAWYAQLLKEMIGQIALRMTKPIDIGLQFDAHFGLPQKSTSGMEAGLYDAKGGIAGKPAKCVITVSALGDAQSDIDVQAEMAHEAWHCYEGAIVGLNRYYSQDPAPWVVEGEADWVAAVVVPEAPLAQQGWWDYLDKPERPLFSRTYDGVGYFGHLGDSGTNPWDKVVPVLEATSNPSAFTAAGADAEPFLDSWASSYLDDASRGAPWHMTGPALAPTKKPPVTINVPNGGSVAESAPAYANMIGVLAETPEVLLTTFSGRARLSDSNGHDYLAGDSGAFCMLPTGCVCPGSSGEPPPLPLEGARVALGVTGGTKGTTGTLVGMKLDDLCKKGITGTWDGSARVNLGGVTNGFTLTVVQKGTAFKGTVDLAGPNCVHHGDVTGTVSGGDISMRWSTAGLQPVVLEGTLSGNTMSGTFTAISCPPSNLEIDGTWSATKRK